MLTLAAATLAVAGTFMAQRSATRGSGPAPASAAKTQELSASLSELRSIRGEMEEIEAKTRAAFLEYARDHASRAASELAALHGEIGRAQNEVTAALRTSTVDLDRFVAMRSNADFDRLTAAHDLVRQRLADIATRQEQALGILSLCANAKSCAQAQQAAAEAQARVAQGLKKLEEARGIARGSRQRSADEQQYEHFTYHLARAERRIAEKPGELDALGQRQEVLAGMISGMERSIATASTEDRPPLESQLAVLRAESVAVQDKSKSADKQLADARKNVEKLQGRVAEIEAVLTKQAQPATDADQALRSLQTALAGLQAEAAKLQEAAVMPGPVQALPESELLGALEKDGSTRPETAAGTPEIHAQALREEAAIAAAFHRVRAMELTIERGIPLEAAVAMTGLAPARPSAATPPPGSAMLRRAQAMLAQAKGGDRPRFPREKVELGGRIEDLSGQPGPQILLPGGPGGPPALPELGSIPALSANAAPLPAGLGPSRPWVFVDRWQVLGPFDNPRRENLDTRFPPETVVDPEASYPGKNGVPIAWEACQSATPNTMPPFRAYNLAHRIEGLTEETSYLFNLQYTVYYAYAEVRLEKEADLWLAIGSDDHSKIWLNDRLVWSGGKGAKPWRADEGYRKLTFRAGTNRILYRIENGNDRTEFSLLLGVGH